MIDFRDRQQIGRTDLFVSPLAFGCWGISSSEWGGPPDVNKAKEVLSLAWSKGVNFFDTAGIYGEGFGERVFGNLQWRHDAIIATKVSARARPSPPIQPLKEYYERNYLINQVEDSLRRLRRDYIDLLQLHNWYNEWKSDANYIMDIFHQLRFQGKIRALGLSLPDWTIQNIDYLMWEGGIDCVQMPLSIFQQWGTKFIIGSALRHHVGIIARSPLDSGLLRV